MKLNTNIIVLALAAALCSCSKQEAATQPAVETSVTGTAEAAKAVEAVATSEPVKAAADTAPPAVEAPKVPEVAKPAEDASIQELIAKARTLAAEKKYAEASAVVQQLSSKALNADQATLVEGLKQEIQKALTAKATDNAVGALGNALPK